MLIRVCLFVFSAFLKLGSCFIDLTVGFNESGRSVDLIESKYCDFIALLWFIPFFEKNPKKKKKSSLIYMNTASRGSKTAYDCFFFPPELSSKNAGLRR